MPWIGGAIAGGGALLGGLFGSDAASDAAAAQAASADRAAQLQKEMFERQIQLQEPFRQAGLTAQQRYLNMLGLQGQAPTMRSEAELRNALAAQYMRPGTEGRYETSYVGMGGDAGGQQDSRRMKLRGRHLALASTLVISAWPILKQILAMLSDCKKD